MNGKVKVTGGGYRLLARGLVALTTLAVAPILIRASALEERLIILANSRQPESVALARFYAGQRGVPAVNIVALPLPEEEGITWRQFIDQVWQPVQDELYRRGWLEGTESSLLDRFGRRRYAFTGHRMSYLVACRGVPLRIHEDPMLLPPEDRHKGARQFFKNEGAVDAELSAVAMGDYEITGAIANPLFAREGSMTLDAMQVVKVSRLDGPTWEHARRLVTTAIEAERSGLIGRYYVDLKGPHADGDGWLTNVRERARRMGFDGSTEETGGMFSTADRFDAPILYAGWYADNLVGPFTREGFEFPIGAIAVHIHSFSARTLHSATEAWCGPLVARGATATVGNVFEPYLAFTHRPDLLLHALTEGKNFGDAVYYALPALSWQAVAFGDPLYRPFAVSFPEQRAQVAALPPMRSAYVWLRQAILAERDGNFSEAASALRAALRCALLADNSVLAEDVARRLASREADGAVPVMK